MYFDIGFKCSRCGRDFQFDTTGMPVEALALMCGVLDGCLCGACSVVSGTPMILPAGGGIQPQEYNAIVVSAVYSAMGVAEMMVDDIMKAMPLVSFSPN